MVRNDTYLLSFTLHIPSSGIDVHSFYFCSFQLIALVVLSSISSGLEDVDQESHGIENFDIFEFTGTAFSCWLVTHKIERIFYLLSISISSYA